MTFRLTALDPAPFAGLFTLSDQALAAKGIVRMTVDEHPGYPCRVSLEDAPVGEQILLLNHPHQPDSGPYQSAHAIFVRPGVAQAHPAPGEVPPSIASRLLSVRAFDANHLMTDAEVVAGTAIAPLLDRFFADPSVSYVQLHNARRGCFAATAVRA